MSFLIIGSEGFIGSKLVGTYKTKHDIFGVDLYDSKKVSYPYKKINDLSKDLKQIFESKQFSVIINAAGSGSVQKSMDNPKNDFKANCFDTIIILDAIRKYQPTTKYVHISSAAVYGNPQKLPIQENDITNPLSIYGWHKLISEKLCFEYASIFNLHTAILRPFSVYGPGLKKQMFWDLYQKSKNVPLEIFGTGLESRDYIFIDDLIEAISLIIKKSEFNSDVYNIASGTETTIRDAVSIFFNNFENKIEYYFNNKVRKGDPLNWKADISKLKKLGFTPSVKLEKGMLKTVKWLKRNG